MTTVGDVGERGIIEWIRERLPRPDGLVVPCGDDAAVVRDDAPGFDWVFTSDPVVEGVHFERAADPAAVGHKAVGRVLSDLAAMGARPAWALVNLSCPAAMPVARLWPLVDGMLALAGRHGLAVIGGDTGQGPVLACHVFAAGRLPAGTACRRAGARAGDTLWVTGELGGSLAGRHLAFEPRVAEGIWLREGGWCRAMCDVSDGLARDLGHIAAAGGVGAAIRLERLPISAAARAAADGRTPVAHALYDGEDFELLFSVAAERGAALAEAWRAAFATRLTRIGTVTAGGGVVGMQDGDCRRLEGGYEHFAAR